MSTNRLHKQLDAYFEANGLFYDRRKGHYKDQGKPISQIVSILTLVQAVVAILEKKPNDARGRPRDYVTKEKKRWIIFGADDYRQPGQGEIFDDHKPFDLPVYLQCVRILRRVDQFLEKPSLKLDNSIQRNLRFYLARHASCFLTKSAYCPPATLNIADVNKLSDDDLLKMFRIVFKIYQACGGDDDAAKGTSMTAHLDAFLAKTYSPPNKDATSPPKAKRASA